ncbi:MAG: hypothetical protein ACLFRP_09230 [Puniceicoccaceae bacterium]
MIRTKEKRQASLLSVLAGAFAAALIGLMAGFATEASRLPLSATPAASENEKTITPVFPTGRSDGSGDWEGMLRRLAEGNAPGSSLEFNEADLNRVADEYLNFTLGKEQAADKQDRPPVAFLPDTPNFRIADSLLQCVLPFEIFVPGFEGKALFVVVGGFAGKDGAPRFAVEEAWINSARIPPLAAKVLIRSLTGSIRKLSPDSPLFAAWKRIDSIRLSGDTATVTAR